MRQSLIIASKLAGMVLGVIIAAGVLAFFLPILAAIIGLALLIIAIVSLIFKRKTPNRRPILPNRWQAVGILLFAFAIMASAVERFQHLEDMRLEAAREVGTEEYLALLRELRGEDAWMAALEEIDPERFQQEQEQLAEAERQRLAAEREAELERQAAQAERDARLREERAQRDAEIQATRAARTAARVAEYMEEIEQGITSARSYRAENFDGNLALIRIGAEAFVGFAEDYAAGFELDLTDVQLARRAEFRREIIAAQQRSLAHLRDRAGPALREELWIADASARTFGAGFNTIEFVAGDFVANRNIRDFQIEMRDFFQVLRFKRSQYKWYEEASEYQYYDMDTPNDTDLIIQRAGQYVVYSGN